MLQAAVLVGSGKNARHEDTRRRRSIALPLPAACVSQVKRCLVPVSLTGHWGTRHAVDGNDQPARSACSRLVLVRQLPGTCGGLRPARDDDGRLRLRRVYHFEYSDTGDNRRQGHVTLLGSDLLMLHLPHAPAPRLRVVASGSDELH